MAYLAREDAKQVYYEDYGSGDSAVVLIHGWGMGVRTWDYTLPALVNAGHRVIALDHRGCGKSDKDFADMGILAIAGDVVAVIKSLDLNKVVLNGWSLGGAVAVEAASQLGQVCCGLVLTCGATPVYLQKPDYPHGGTDEALAGTLAAISADRVNFLAALSQGICASEITPEQVTWMWQIFMESSPLAAASLAELGPLDQREILASLATPILSFVGSHDAVVDPEVCRSVAQYNNNVTTVEMENSGHAPFIDETARYDEAFHAFVGSCL
ncbi:MAG: pimeloyl-ACP methyl ester carboxylesterase [Alcanivorax sp.]|jgi:pimeloyl-ACP methyl ester carboxylesterase